MKDKKIIVIKNNDLTSYEFLSLLELISDEKQKLTRNCLADIDSHWSLCFLDGLEQKLRKEYLKRIQNEQKRN